MDTKVMKAMEENWIAFLRAVMMKNGCPVEVGTAEDVVRNLTYLTQKTDTGSVFLPLQYKKIVEKLLFGFGKSAIEYDKDDVYFEKVDNITICTANVRWIIYNENGEKMVLGRGTCSVNIDEIMPGEFKSAGERAAKMRATAIGKAKTRAYYDGGLGLELFGDIPEVIAADLEPSVTKAETSKEDTPGTKTSKAESGSKVSDLPAPKPKRVPKGLKAVKTEKEMPKKERLELKAEAEKAPASAEKESAKHSESEKTSEPEPSDNDELTLEDALAVRADAGNFKGDTLEAILDILPRNIVWLTVNGKSERVRKAAMLVKQSNAELREI